jgi:pyruvate,orthophosphate dikinase
MLSWADSYRRMHVLANAETIEDVKKAKEMGAEGIGLCRTGAYVLFVAV